VGHAYRASPRVARAVRPDDALELVGDEALVCARALDGEPRARVVVAPSRQAAIDFAAQTSTVVVVDGVAQTAPRRASLALLALDGLEPWGRACATPPRGDLRAPIAALLGACDVTARIGEDVVVHSDGARLSTGELLDWDRLRALRVGLATAVARPRRILLSLERRGVHPIRALTLTFADHHPPRSLPRVPGIDLWLVSSKCGVALSRSALPALAEVAEIDYRLEVEGALLTRLRAACEKNT
jgi:tetraacyldisaccharide-1-P 4'-kinase